ncbi:hypothetical protein, partial [Actinotalea sp.]|uniref:hypothetical protein n=1 Tax=Actinotalea sp. TaxID=1872145 RepID=UPI0035659939
MTTLTGASLVWGSMTFYGDRSSDSVPVMSTLEGWDGLPSGRDGFANRPRGHGAFDDKVFADPRYVRVSGISVSAADRDALLVGLGATLTFDDELAPLTVTAAGRTLTA